jgi:CO/xanthine dehydrogenase FAD-binding subunit
VCADLALLFGNHLEIPVPTEFTVPQAHHLLCDADVVLRGPSGERVVAAADFFVSYLTTALRPDELLSAVRIPRPSPRTGTAFRELSRRHGDFALVGAGARVTLDDAGDVTAARIAFIGVAATPVVVELPVEDVDGGARAPAAALEPAGDVHASAAYRRHVAAVLAADVLGRAVAAAGREP